MNVTFYTTHCPKCKVLKTKLDQKNVEYVENDSVEDMLELGIKSAPYLGIDNKLYDFSASLKWINELEE